MGEKGRREGKGKGGGKKKERKRKKEREKKEKKKKIKKKRNLILFSTSGVLSCPIKERIKGRRQGKVLGRNKIFNQINCPNC